MRICPHCQQHTDEKICPDDGFQTVDPSRLARNTVQQLVGTIFQARFRLDSLLGAGGFGAVYKATQLAVERPVAVKILHEGAARTLNDLARFQREARAIAAVNHPNIISLVDFGQTDSGRLFLVTEFIEGRELSQVIRDDSPLPSKRIVDIGVQLLDGLDQCHAAGIIHRDLKPENVFVSKRGRLDDFVTLFDFGIAKMHSEAGQTLTATGTAIGTPKYMSPEQARSWPLTPQADIYGVGLILYELLCGRPAFERADTTAYLLAHATQPPAPPSHGDELLEGPLVDFIMRCLSKLPADRPQGAARAAALLDACRDAPLRRIPRSTPARSPRATRTKAGYGGTLVALATERSSTPIEPPDAAAPRRWAPAAAAAALIAAAGVIAAVALTGSDAPKARRGDASVALGAATADPVTELRATQTPSPRAAPSDAPAEVAATPSDAPAEVAATPSDAPAEAAATPHHAGGAALAEDASGTERPSGAPDADALDGPDVPRPERPAAATPPDCAVTAHTMPPGGLIGRPPTGPPVRAPRRLVSEGCAPFTISVERRGYVSRQLNISPRPGGVIVVPLARGAGLAKEERDVLPHPGDALAALLDAAKRRQPRLALDGDPIDELGYAVFDETPVRQPPGRRAAKTHRRRPTGRSQPVKGARYELVD